jgi:hypothetical protein
MTVRASLAGNIVKRAAIPGLCHNDTFTFPQRSIRLRFVLFLNELYGGMGGHDVGGSVYKVA